MEGENAAVLPPPPVQAPIANAANAQVPVPPHQEDNPNQPSISLDLHIAGPERPASGNWGNDSIASLFHVFAEAKVQKFVIAKDACTSRAELQAGQTQHDKFWTIVHCFFNYGSSQ
jgi:hypothetical protein